MLGRGGGGGGKPQTCIPALTLYEGRGKTNKQGSNQTTNKNDGGGGGGGGGGIRSLFTNLAALHVSLSNPKPSQFDFKSLREYTDVDGTILSGKYYYRLINASWKLSWRVQKFP